MALNVGSIASRIVVVAEPHTPVVRVAQLMRESHIGAVIVIEDMPPKNRPVGIITDRDLVVEVLAMEVDYRALTAAEIMTSNPTTVHETDAIFDTIEVMQHTGVRRLPVIDDENRLVGIVTFDDLVEFLAKELGDLAQTIRLEEQREERARK